MKPFVAATVLAAASFLVCPSVMAGPSVAVCNLSNLYQDCSMSKDRRAELEAQRTRAEKELQVYKSKLEELERRVPLYEKDSQEYKKLMDDIEGVKSEANAKKRVETAHLEKKFSDFLKEFHEIAMKAITQVSKDQGYDFVLQVTDPNIARFDKAEPLLNRIFTQNVLYSVESVDITNKVMKKLDEDYDAAKLKKDE